MKYELKLKMSISTNMVQQMSTECYKFGPYKIDSKEVFYSTALSYAMVNLRPVVPGNYY